MAERSPNFPSINLGDAIEAVRAIYQREGRSLMPRLSAAKALGYNSMNGRSLSKLGALRGYGLLEGRGDDVKVSAVAITLLNAPKESKEWREALVSAFESPPGFALLLDKGEASPGTLRWHLVKANFRDDAAERSVQVFLESRDLVNSELGAYKFGVSAAASPVEAEDEFAPLLHPVPSSAPQPIAGGETQQRKGAVEAGLAMSAHERVLQSGMLSKAASYRVIVSGPVGVAEIDRLLKKLEVDKEILADADSEPQHEEDNPDDI
jgi:hypothetical protein